jgi:hypothetical protein
LIRRLSKDWWEGSTGNRRARQVSSSLRTPLLAGTQTRPKTINSSTMRGLRSVLARRLSSTFILQRRLIRVPAAYKQVFPSIRWAEPTLRSQFSGNGFDRGLTSVLANNPVETANVLQEIPSRKFWHDTFHELTAISEDPRNSEGQEKAVCASLCTLDACSKVLCMTCIKSNR